MDNKIDVYYEIQIMDDRDNYYGSFIPSATHLRGMENAKDYFNLSIERCPKNSFRLVKVTNEVIENKILPPKVR